MRIIFSTFIILILKVAVFMLALSFAKDHPLVIIFVICSVFFYIRCVIFKENENEPINFLNHGDFLSEFPSLAFFYFFRPDFKTALYFHLSFGSLHYLQYFAFLISNTLDLIWRGVKGIFTRLKKVIPRIEPQVLRAQPSPPPQPSPPEEIAVEEKPIPVKKAPKKRPSIYDI